MTSRVMIVLLALVCAGSGFGADVLPSVFSWLHWRNGTLVTESQVMELRANLYDPLRGCAITTPQQLGEVGWTVTEDGFLKSPERAGGGRLTVQVSGLPMGDHDVYVRFFGRPRKPGESWWFFTYLNLGDGVGEGKPENRPPNSNMYQFGPAGGAHPIRLVAGTGGFDETTVYEIYLGRVENASSLALWMERYEWSQVAKIGSIRIETLPNCDLSAALEDTPENRTIRKRLFFPGKVYGYGVVPGALKVRPKQLSDLKLVTMKEVVDLDAARNEVENAQIVLFSDRQDLKHLKWKIGTLKTASGETLRGTVTLHPVGYMRMEHFDLGVNGWWPDPIMTGMDSLSIPRGDVQTLWFQVKTAADAVPGEYRAELVLSAENAPAVTIPVRLKVRRFELPAMSQLRVVMGCNDGSGGFETDYKINPSTIYGWEKDGEQLFGNWAEREATAINLDYIWSQQLDQSTHMPTQEQLDSWIASLKGKLALAERHGLRDKCYLYCFDEATEEWRPALEAITRAIKKEIPDLPILTTAAFPWCGEGTISSVDWWCPQINNYDFAAAERARAAGKQVWMYVCNNPEKPFPNLRITANTAMDHRILTGFMAGAMRYDGFLYWSTRAKWQTPAISGDSVYTTWTIQDDGDGQLYQNSSNGPIPSIRLELFRDGLEDYDMLKIAEKLAADPDRLSAEARKLLPRIAPYFAPGNPVVKSQTEFTQSPEELESARRLVMDFIEAAE